MNSFRPLFRVSSAADRIKLFRALFDARELDTDLALALLKVIHRELGNEQERDRTAYKRYAETIETLRYYKRDMLAQVVSAWNEKRKAHEAEWQIEGVPQ